MADALYTRAAATALRLIKRYGQTMTLRRITTGAYAAGAAVQSQSDESVSGVVLDFTDYERAAGLIDINDRKVMLAASGMTAAPALEDQLIASTVTFKIVNSKPLSPAGVPIIYELQVRG